MHTCHAVNCRNKIEPQFLMCPRHWYMVPKHVQAKVWKYWANGGVDKDPSAADAAADLAIAHAAHRDGQLDDIGFQVAKNKAAQVFR